MTRAALAVTLGALIASPGCRRDRSPDPIGAGVGLAPVADEQGGRGLEIELWVIEDRGGELARALRGYPEPAPAIDRASARAWRDSGFRLVSVPVDELRSLQSSLRFVAPVRSESLVDATRWRAVARGPRLAGEQVETAFGAAPLRDGWARMLARAWPTPHVREGEPARARLRVELAPQIVRPEREDSLDQLEARLQGRGRGISEDGPVLRELLLSAAMDAGRALLVVGEDPEADWETLGEGVEVEPGGGPGGDGEGAPVGPVEPVEVAPDGGGEGEPAGGVGMGAVSHARGRVVSGVVSQPAGPGAPERRTLGEAMLVGGVGVFPERGEGGDRLRVGRRAVIVIVPRVSGAYRILPRVRASADAER